MWWKIVLLTALTIGCGVSPPAVSPDQAVSQPRAKNIILMIGDGMGLSQISAGVYARRKSMNLERFKSIGLQKTHCKDKLITDSAASATAMARGIKADYSTFGTTLQSKAPPSILEELEQRGWSTGLTVTSSLTHATPAAFYTYQLSRAMYEEIALDLMKSDIDFLVGGGLRHFNRRTMDERDLLEEMKRSGYQVTSFIDEPLADLNIFSSSKFIYFTANEEPLQHSMGRDYLESAAIRGAQYLSKQNTPGFFYLIEGSQIDWAGHANEADWMVDEVLEFDLVVGKMLDFAKRDGETLLIVTSDHETGGFAVVQEGDRGELIMGFNSKDHTPTMVPVFAYGPGESLFQGVYDNTEIYHKMRQALGLPAPTQ